VQTTGTVLLAAAEAAAAVADMLTAAAIRTATGFRMTAAGQFLRYSLLFPIAFPGLASAFAAL
jgi:hypothetical protein